MSCNKNMTTNDRNPCMLLISVIFQPCTFVRHFPVLHFPALHFCPIYSSPAFSTPTPPIFHCPSFYCLAFSAPPISADSLYCCVTANAHAVTVTTVTCIYSAPPTIRPMAHSRLQSSHRVHGVSSMKQETLQRAPEWYSRTQEFKVGRQPIPSTGCGKRESPVTNLPIRGPIYLLPVWTVTVRSIATGVYRYIYPQNRYPFCSRVGH